MEKTKKQFYKQLALNQLVRNESHLQRLRTAATNLDKALERRRSRPTGGPTQPGRSMAHAPRKAHDTPLGSGPPPYGLHMGVGQASSPTSLQRAAKKKT